MNNFTLPSNKNYKPYDNKELDNKTSVRLLIDSGINLSPHQK